jgi:hypothetical protein
MKIAKLKIVHRRQEELLHSRPTRKWGFHLRIKMFRPIVMMAEIEPPEGLSARKLVLETGKYNVITAYSLKEALETLATFPKVHAVVLHASLCKERDCDQVIGEIKQRHPGMTVIALSPVSSHAFKIAELQHFQPRTTATAEPPSRTLW